MNDNNIFTDEQCAESCYALGWSFGEICVNCGCCSDDEEMRLMSRMAYHMDMYDEASTDTAKMHHKRKVNEYREKLKRLDEDE